ncbi:MAG: hypothetical protein COA38_16615 [Fluviicola sp.]|nr:MAG: hypothetical protein COA38_16615 [Fluviicola sp.]
MKKNILFGTLSTLLILLTLSSCDKTTQKGKINRDCTGTYLELNDKDYLICNPTMTNSFQDGSSVRVKFKSESSCPSNSVTFICYLYHKSYGFVEITEIQ